MPSTPTAPPPRYDLLISLDRSDRHAALALLDLQAGTWLSQSTLDLSPEALDAWWRALCSQHPRARLAVAFEQPAPHLLAFFAARAPAAIYALNPASVCAYRRSLVDSRARNDSTDAHYQALYVAKHLAELRPWQAPPPAAAELDRLSRSRRKRVDERTALCNRLEAVLKRCFPQALDLLHEDLWRPMNLAFLRRWPSAERLRQTPISHLRSFYREHHSRSEKRWALRSGRIPGMIPLGPMTEADGLELETHLNQLEALNLAISAHDRAIARRFAAAGASGAWIAALPGAGPALAPRIYAALSIHGPHTCDAAQLAAALGIAPVTDQSGGRTWVHRRYRCDEHTRQTFVEWAKESWKHSIWAESFVRERQARGQAFHAIIRALAYKWIRILWRCWKDGSAYDETHYVQQLRQKRRTPQTPPPAPPPAQPPCGGASA